MPGAKQWVFIGVDYFIESIIDVVFFYLQKILIRNVAFPTQIFLQIVIFKVIYYTDFTWCVVCFHFQYSNSVVYYITVRDR